MTRRVQCPGPIVVASVLILTSASLPGGVLASPPPAQTPAQMPVQSPAQTPAQPVPSAPDVAGGAWHVFANKCSKCHGPESAGKKTKFHTILDLPKLAASPRLVVPYRPEASKLWRSVRDDDMPPEDSHLGPLSAGEKQAVRAWIEAGAPAPPPSASFAPSSTARLAPADDREAEPLPVRALHWVGRFHVVVIHFPIALLMAAALLEAWAMVRRRPAPADAVRYCVTLAAAGAVAAALLGWSRVSFNGYQPASARMLNLHRWLGTAAGVLAVAAAALALTYADGSRHPLRFRATLFGSALLVGAAAHLGGTLVHGDDYFAW